MTISINNPRNVIDWTLFFLWRGLVIAAVGVNMASIATALIVAAATVFFYSIALTLTLPNPTGTEQTSVHYHYCYNDIKVYA